MRFNEAWSKIAYENIILKFGFIALIISNLVVLFLFISESTKEPIVIERSCSSELFHVSSSKQTDREIKSFVTQSLTVRFNTHTDQDPLVWLITEEAQARIKEQNEMKLKSIEQTILVRDVTINNGKITVEMDRMLAVNQVRSAFRFPVQVEINSKERTTANPYGLIITKVAAIKEEKEDSSKPVPPLNQQGGTNVFHE